MIKWSRHSSRPQAHPPFRKGVGIRGLIGNIDDLNACRLKHGVERLGELSVMIANPILHRQLTVLELPGHLPRLLRDPGVVRMRRATRKIYLARTVLDEKQTV
jgi:hypothetical protein